jgi:hypothetical protein
MEEDNYSEYIEDDVTDIYMAANRYNAELNKITEIYERHYPSLVTNLYADGLNNAVGVAGGYAFCTSTGINTSHGSDFREIEDLKETVRLLRNEVMELKLMLKHTLERKIQNEHRKISL